MRISSYYTCGFVVQEESIVDQDLRERQVFSIHQRQVFSILLGSYVLIAVALTVRYTSQVGIQLNEHRWNVTATMNLCSGSCAPDIMWHH